MKRFPVFCDPAVSPALPQSLPASVQGLGCSFQSWLKHLPLVQDSKGRLLHTGDAHHLLHTVHLLMMLQTAAEH